MKNLEGTIYCKVSIFATVGIHSEGFLTHEGAGQDLSLAKLCY